MTRGVKIEMARPYLIFALGQTLFNTWKWVHVPIDKLALWWKVSFSSPSLPPLLSALAKFVPKSDFRPPRFASIKYDVTLFTYDVPLLWRPQNVQQGIHDYPIKPSKSFLYRLMLTWVCYIDWPKTMIVHFLPTTVTAYFMARRCVTVDGGDQTVH